MQNFVTLLIGIAVSVFLVWVFLPERGLYARWRYTLQVTNKTRREDAIKHIFDCEVDGREPSAHSIAGALHIDIDAAHALITDLEQRELVECSGAAPLLTKSGQDLALHLLRAHRLWERYLADETGFPEQEWHGLADRREHLLSPEDLEKLSARLSHPVFDPHGDPIPTASGELGDTESIPLPSVKADTLFQIVHLEDEPETVYAQLVAEGLHPGMTLRLLDRDPQRIRFWAGGDEHVLAPLVAANIHVAPIEQVVDEFEGERLNDLSVGESGEVLALSPSLRGAERRRMMDLGLLPGTNISAEYTSPGSDPVAYRIRGALIALREEQASQIIVKKIGRGEYE